MGSLENVLYLQSNQNNVTMSCFINGSLFTEVLPLCGCWNFLKANKFLGFRTSCGGLWICALGPGGPLHEVFCTWSAFTYTGFACFADVAVVTGAEGVVVLKGVAVSSTVGAVLELYWHCTALCLFCMSFSIWNTFNVLLGVPLTVPFPVLTWDIPLDVPVDVPFSVPFSVLPPFILLKVARCLLSLQFPVGSLEEIHPF